MKEQVHAGSQSQEVGWGVFLLQSQIINEMTDWTANSQARGIGEISGESKEAEENLGTREVMPGDMERKGEERGGAGRKRGNAL